MGSASRKAAAGIAVAGVVGLGLLAVPTGAVAAPVLPTVTPEELVASVLEADPDAFAGTVQADNALGLPAVDGLPTGVSEARIWSNGEEGGRVQLPSDSGERTLVTDGTTFWSWDSAERKVVTGEKGGRPAEQEATTDPAAAATEAIRVLQTSSEVAVDGTSEVAGRPAYELVLTPDPTERTLLREVRVAVDAEQRIPLRLTVLAQGSTDPVLQVGFTELQFGAQDAALFTFTPPPGATVERAEEREGTERPGGAEEAEAARQVVGEGWDTVVVATRPEQPAQPESEDGEDGGDPLAQLAALGTPVSGPWGSGTLITTAVGSAILTDDGRVAAGAVPEQVLTEALGQ